MEESVGKARKLADFPPGSWGCFVKAKGAGNKELARHSVEKERPHVIVVPGGNLKFVKDIVSPSLAIDISRALEMPLHKGMARLQARQYISIFAKDDARDDILLKLAKLDYNRVQKLHQEELRNISM
ncbi:putative terpene synthase 2 [Acorus calamus]|uniref:Terpene synthase 2 n=1 Tax=Acorus calamus TaxID=4465 RepID=A0AAV9CL96_ACOCL|nr:putative terpene synthase 2 [Acorus calamus]